jgi:hypothetical protein
MMTMRPEKLSEIEALILIEPGQLSCWRSKFPASLRQSMI